MKFKIEKGVPPPLGLRERARYPFGEMSPGDSFVVPAEMGRRARAAANAWARDRGLRGAFAVRALPDGSFRVWRLALDAGEEVVSDAARVREWLGDCAVAAPGDRERIADLYASWRGWCASAGLPARSINRLSAFLEHLGYRRFRTARGRGFEGFRLKAPR